MTEDSVVIAKFLSRAEAEMAAEVLLGEGVESLVSLDNAGGAYPMLELVRGVRLRVAAADEERARAVLADLTEVGPLPDDDDDEPEAPGSPEHPLP